MRLRAAPGAPGVQAGWLMHAVPRYVQLGATSLIKGESDLKKFEKARAAAESVGRALTREHGLPGAGAEEAREGHPRGLQEEDVVQGPGRGASLHAA